LVAVLAEVTADTTAYNNSVWLQNWDDRQKATTDTVGDILPNLFTMNILGKRIEGVVNGFTRGK
jgi:hypothetical protein